MPGRSTVMGTVVSGTNQRDYPAEKASSRLLMAYAVTGLLFMLLPGTFLGVWNLFSISSQHQSGSVSPAWIQAHGHAQIFGWIGTYIIGIGFYSIPKLRRMNSWRCGLCGRPGHYGPPVSRCAG